jgi:glycosyltransferase involved in cell wall biosynthesis
MRRKTSKYGIVFYNKGKKGGAERRYYNLICELAKNQHVYLLANSSLLEHWSNLGGFNGNIISHCLEDDTTYKNQTNTDTLPVNKSIPKRSVLVKIKRLIPGRTRSFFIDIQNLVKLNIIVFKWAKFNQLTHINTIQGSGILSVFSKFLGCKLIFSYVDYMVQNGYPFKWIQNQGLKTTIKISNQFDFLSEMIPERMLKKGLKLNQSKINVAPVSFTDYSRFHIKLPKKPIIVFSGRFEQIKNPILALKVAKELVLLNNTFQLKMIGYGSCEKELQDFTNKNNLNNWVKIFSSDTIEDELSDALIFLSLQKENNYPSQALLEAMASGCIPIVTDVGETRNLINETNGFLVHENVEEIVGVIRQILDNQRQFEKKGFDIREQTIKKFSIDTYLDYYHTLFAKA